MKRMIRLGTVFCLAVSFLLLSNVWAINQAESAVVKGYVFLDKNSNGVRDPGEPGIRGVSVSNGRDVVQTDYHGYYTLPALDEMVVFISKPAGFTPPLNENNIPRFFTFISPTAHRRTSRNIPVFHPPARFRLWSTSRSTGNTMQRISRRSSQGIPSHTPIRRSIIYVTPLRRKPLIRMPPLSFSWATMSAMTLFVSALSESDEQYGQARLSRPRQS